MGDTVSVELDQERARRLQLLAIAHHTTPEQKVAALVDAEADRVLGPKRDYRPGETKKRLAEALGWTTIPELTPEERAEFDAKLRQAEEDARRIYGDPQHTAA